MRVTNGPLFVALTGAIDVVEDTGRVEGGVNVVVVR